MATQILIFPFSSTISPFFLLAWLVHSYSNMGKLFLLINYAASVNTLVLFCMGWIELLYGMSNNEGIYNWFNLIKICPFLSLNIISQLACRFFKFNDDFLVYE
jgi:hypothetical protein